MTHIENRKLNNGMEMPFVGLGTYKSEDGNSLVEAVKAAVKSGYRHFDCAYIYSNEQHVGKGIKQAIEESNGKLKREDFFIVSKCWNTFHSKEKVNECLDIILKRLDLDYLDAYLIHWPMGLKEDAGNAPADENGKMIPSDVHYVDTYKAMEELHDKGKIKAIGLSNFNPDQVKDILNACRIKPICNQFEVNPLLQNKEWVDFCLKENIAVVAYAPLGAPDRPWGKSDEPMPLEHPSILNLAKKHNKSPAQIILRWLIQRGIVVIPKSVTPSRIDENSRVFDFKLSDEEMNVFNEFKHEFRYYKETVCDNHRFFPFKKNN